MKRCYGPKVDPTCGVLFCPRGADPPEDMDWDEYCELCQGERDAHLELVADGRRDEG